jgi:N-acetylglucosaminyldiphosphoundecaprenol N-acetyl-beta-D-mannosaminyltransferase
MDFTPSILEKANEKKLSVFVYGSTADVINSFKEKIARAYSDIRFAGAISPPFRTFNDEEIKNDIEKINRSDANLVFVALGCPQTRKMDGRKFREINAGITRHWWSIVRYSWSSKKGAEVDAKYGA